MLKGNRWSNNSPAWSDVLTLSETGAVGSVAVQLKFVNSGGGQISVPVTGRFYLSEVATGLTMDPADTSIAALTNGAVRDLDAANTGWQFVTTASGLLGVTITALADSYWMVFESPLGGLIITDELIVD